MNKKIVFSLSIIIISTYLFLKEQISVVCDCSNLNSVSEYTLQEYNERKKNVEL
jgi:hypothetical protein